MKIAIHAALAAALVTASTAAFAGEITGPPPTVNGNPAIGKSAKPTAAVLTKTATTAITSTGAMSRASRRTSISSR